MENLNTVIPLLETWRIKGLNKKNECKIVNIFLLVLTFVLILIEIAFAVLCL